MRTWEWEQERETVNERMTASTKEKETQRKREILCPLVHVPDRCNKLGQGQAKAKNQGLCWLSHMDEGAQILASFLVH